MSFSLGIPCYRQVEELDVLLASVPAGVFEEVIVVDDGNDPPVDPATLECKMPVRVIRFEQNRGLGEGRNALCAAASTDSVVFVDADAEILAISLSDLQAAFNEPNVVALTGRALEDPSGSVANRWRHWFWRQDHGEGPSQVNLAYGLCSVWERGAVSRLGGFDPRRKANAEDVDLSIRARQEGYVIRHVPSFVVIHRRRDNLRSLMRMVWRHSYSFSAVCRNHHDRDYVRGLVNALKWLPITIFSSLRRHRDVSLALVSVPCCFLSILARVIVGITPRQHL